MITKFELFENSYIGHKISPVATSFTPKVIDPMTTEPFKTLLYKDPTPKDIEAVNKFLRANKFACLKLYHGTSDEHDIMNQGLMKTKESTKKSLQSQPGFTYLSLFPSMAKTFGEMSYPYNKITVYEIDAPIYHLKPDADQLRNKRLHSNIDCGNSLGDSALYGHGFRIKGNIPPYMIKIYKG